MPRSAKASRTARAILPRSFVTPIHLPGAAARGGCIRSMVAPTRHSRFSPDHLEGGIEGGSHGDCLVATLSAIGRVAALGDEFLVHRAIEIVDGLPVGQCRRGARLSAVDRQLTVEPGHPPAAGELRLD